MGSSDVIETLRGLPPRHFEQFIADVWQERQDWTTEVVDPGPDKGVDVMGEPPGGGPKTALQCKRYAEWNKVTGPRIREYAALRQRWTDVEGVTVVTTGSFTSDALEEAERLDVKCIDGEDLVKLIDRYGAEDILEWYAAGKPKEGP